MSKAADKTVIQNLAVNHYLFHVNQRKFHQVMGEFIIGRQTGNLILSRDPKIGHQHCRFKVKGMVLLLSDLGTTNKTYLNGKEVGSDDVLKKDWKAKIRVINSFSSRWETKLTFPSN